MAILLFYLERRHIMCKISLLVLFLIILDQLSKYFVGVKNFMVNYSFFLRPTVNMMLYYFDFKILIIILSVSAYLCWLFKNNKGILIGILFAIAGSFSNLLDYFFRGFVIDWIKLCSLPIFNFADFYIVLGSLIGVIFVLIPNAENN